MRYNEIIFLEVEDVLRAHDIAIKRHGGGLGVRDLGLLDSAVMAPRAGYYDSLAAIASAYAHGIALNHPFIDGNKRAAIAAAGAFLNVHGHRLILPRSPWADRIRALAAGELDREALERLLVEAMGGDPGTLE